MDCFRLQAALSVGILLAPQGIDTHRKRNDKADNNLLPERRYVEDIKAVADQRQKDPTKVPDILPLPPESEAPPITTAAIASISYPCAA